MSIYKKCLMAALAAIIIILTGCGGNNVLPTTTPHEVTTPEIPEGVISDTVHGRFLLEGDNLYYAASDSIQLYNGGVSLVVTADQPSYLGLAKGRLIYRCVSKRTDYRPSEYELRSFNPEDGTASVLASGQIEFAACYNDKIYYTENLTDLYSIEEGQSKKLLSGEITAPFMTGNAIYMGLDGSLCSFSMDTGVYVSLLDKCYPQNITAEDGKVYYCTEDSLKLASYEFSSGEITEYEIDNYGLTIYKGQHYYVVNNNGFYLMRAKNGAEDERLLSLGALQNCSAPFFADDAVYFFINADDYYGLIRCNITTGSIERLSSAEG